MYRKNKKAENYLEDALEISIGHDWSWHGEALLVLGGVDLVEGVESGLSPDAEAANVSTRGQFEKVQLVNWKKSDTGDVAESE